MPACQFSVTQRRGRREIAVQGAFDGPTAWSLTQSLQAEPGAVRVDFGPATSCSDYALMVLAHALLDRAGSALLIGLRKHQLRMLRYLGVTVSDAGVVGGPEVGRATG